MGKCICAYVCRVDEFGAYAVQCIKSQGVGTVVPLVLIRSSLPAKKQQAFRRDASKYMETHFNADISCAFIVQLEPSDAMDSTASTVTEWKPLFRLLTESRLHAIHWRSHRCYMLVCTTSTMQLYTMMNRHTTTDLQ